MSIDNKNTYLNSLRANSVYPTYRSVIGLIAILGYLLAGIVALGAVVIGIGVMSKQGFFSGLLAIIFGLVWAALIFFLSKFWKEASLILADIGDSIVDANSKTSRD